MGEALGEEGKGVNQEKKKQRKRSLGEKTSSEAGTWYRPCEWGEYADIPMPQSVQLGLLQRKKLQREEGSLGGPRGLAHI